MVPNTLFQEVRASVLERVQPTSKLALVSHPKAKLTVHGRQLLVDRVLEAVERADGVEVLIQARLG